MSSVGWRISLNARNLKMTILERIQILRGTATQNAAFTGLEGELVYLTDTKQVRIHDGVTAGGNAASSDILTRIEE